MFNSSFVIEISEPEPRGKSVDFRKKEVGGCIRTFLGIVCSWKGM